MTSNKKINLPVKSMSSEKIYALLDTIASDDEEDIENLMNNLDTEFIDESLIENGGSESDLSLATSCLDIENYLSDSNAPTPIEAVVTISQPGSDSDDDVPLSNLQVPKADKEWKWRKQFKKAYVEKCVFAEDGIVNIDVQDPSPMQIFAKTVDLEGWFCCWKPNRRDTLSKMEECFKPRWKNCVRFLE